MELDAEIRDGSLHNMPANPLCHADRYDYNSSLHPRYKMTSPGSIGQRRTSIHPWLRTTAQMHSTHKPSALLPSLPTARSKDKSRRCLIIDTSDNWASTCHSRSYATISGSQSQHSYSAIVMQAAIE